MENLKTAAEIARQRLTHDLWNLNDAKSWADGVILRMDRPHEWLIDVSTASTMAEARNALLQAEGAPDSNRVWAALTSDWLGILEAQPDRDTEVAKVLFRLALAGEVPSRDAAHAMYAFWDAIDLAKGGSFGTVEEERAKLMNFLRQWSASEEAQSAG